MSRLKRILLGAWVSWTILLIISLGHILLLIGQVNENFRQWLMGQKLLFNALYEMFFNAWVYALVLLAVINLIRIRFEQDPVGRRKAKKWIKPWASLKLAVPVILLVGIFSAVGTIVESQYNLEGAQKMVYQTWWMYSVLALLCITLFAVILDRLPWKPHHAAFIFAHIGIILLLLGSLETRMKGVDGSMSLGIGESNRFVTLPDTDVAVFSSFDGSQYTQIFRQEVDVYKDDFTQDPLEIRLEDEPLKVIESVRYAIPKESIQEGKEGKGSPAVRFQVNSDKVNVNEWLMSTTENKEVTYEFGPAQLHLVQQLPGSSRPDANEIYLAPVPGSENNLRYRVFSRGKGVSMEGEIEEGGSFELPWMGLNFRVLRYLPNATKRWDVTQLERPTPLTTAALKVSYKGEDYWLQQNDLLKFFTDSAVFIVTFQNRRADVGFPIRLDEFKVGRYQGTMRASSYSSRVHVPQIGEYLIAMNEPLIHNGFTFYQASFQEDEQGNPTASILSVNQDPGRWEKYLGSLMIVMGIAMMFWFKKKPKSLNARRQEADRAVG